MTRTDPEGCFISRHWLKWLSEQRILGSSQSGEAHWRTSTVDRTIQTVKDGATRLSQQMQESIPVDEMLALVNTAFSDVCVGAWTSSTEAFVWSTRVLLWKRLWTPMTFFLRVLSHTSGRNEDVLHFMQQLLRSLQHVFVEPHERDQGNALLGNLVSCVSTGEREDAQSNFRTSGRLVRSSRDADAKDVVLGTWSP